MRKARITAVVIRRVTVRRLTMRQRVVLIRRQGGRRRGRA